MKRFFFFIICFFQMLYVSAQIADVSITSVALAGYEPNAPDKLVPPAGNTSEVNVSSGGNNAFQNAFSQMDTATNNTTSTKGKNHSKITGQIPKPLPPFLNCSITVQNEGIDPAKETKLVIVLPSGVNAQSSMANGSVHKAPPGSLAGYVQYNLGDIAVGQSISVSFSFSTSKFYPNKISAFIFSSSSDTNPMNNHKEAGFNL